jgi:dolichyl-phosphate beta-glucosyltransferase
MRPDFPLRCFAFLSVFESLWLVRLRKRVVKPNPASYNAARLSNVFQVREMGISPFLSVVLPAYNEAHVIGKTIESIQRYCADRRYTYEVWVAADGNDGTREAAALVAAEDSRIRVIGTPERRGKGRGIREAITLATGQIIGFVDADYKTPIEELEKLLPEFDRGYDVVIGSRAVAGAVVEIPQPLHRKLGSRVFALVLHCLIGLWKIRDTQCGFKFFRRQVAHDLFGRQKIDGYMFDVEILYLAERIGYCIKEVGVRWRDDADSRFELIAGTLCDAKEILRIRLTRYPESTARTAEADLAAQRD